MWWPHMKLPIIFVCPYKVTLSHPKVPLSLQTNPILVYFPLRLSFPLTVPPDICTPAVLRWLGGADGMGLFFFVKHACSQTPTHLSEWPDVRLLSPSLNPTPQDHFHKKQMPPTNKWQQTFMNYGHRQINNLSVSHWISSHFFFFFLEKSYYIIWTIKEGIQFIILNSLNRSIAFKNV